MTKKTQTNQLNQLNAISPLDGRYFNKTKKLSPIFSEYGLMFYRLQVEIKWFIELSNNPNIKERMIELTIDPEWGLFVLKEDSYKLRALSTKHQAIFTSAFRLFSDHKVTGAGPKMFRKLCAKKEYFVKFSVGHYTYTGCSTHPHNTYIQLLAETGFVGFLIIFSIFFYVFVVFLRQFYCVIFKKKDFVDIYKLNLFICVFISLWPIVPTGSFFNNWLSIIYFMPVPFIIYSHYRNE